MDIKATLKSLLTEEMADKYYDIMNQTDFDDNGKEFVSFSLEQLRGAVSSVANEDTLRNLDSLISKLDEIHHALEQKTYSYNEFEEGVEDTLDDMGEGIKHLKRGLKYLSSIFED